MVSEFSLASDSVSLEALLADDLQLDSLDMVDLILHLNDKQLVAEKIDPTLFRNARTVQDLTKALVPFWK